MVIEKLRATGGADSAKQQIHEARREAAHLLVDEAMDIADELVVTSADVQRNRLRTDTRLKIAGWWNPDYSDKAKVAVSVDFGLLHLQALRTYYAKQVARTEPLVAEIISESATLRSSAQAKVTTSELARLGRVHWNNRDVDTRRRTRPSASWSKAPQIQSARSVTVARHRNPRRCMRVPRRQLGCTTGQGLEST